MQVLPLLGATDCDTNRQGAAECVACIVDTLQFDIVPYVVLLVVPLLGKLFNIIITAGKYWLIAANYRSYE